MNPKLPTPSKEMMYQEALCLALENLAIEHERVRSLQLAVTELRKYVSSTVPGAREALDIVFRDKEIDAIRSGQRRDDLSELLDCTAQRIRHS